MKALAGHRVVQVACGSRDAQTLALTDEVHRQTHIHCLRIRIIQSRIQPPSGLLRKMIQLVSKAVFRRIRMFLSLPDPHPDPLVTSTLQIRVRILPFLIKVLSGLK